MNTRPSHQRVTGHNGNEIYCLHQVGLRPGQLCVGNSVVALGVSRGLGAGLKTLGGGEVTAVTSMVSQSRAQAFARLMVEAKAHGSDGITGVSFELINHGGNFEFVALGSAVHGEGAAEAPCFSSSGDAQQLFCLLDAGFAPQQFVFGNVAYSLGVGGSLLGSLQGLRRGEVPQFSKVFDETRHLALTRIQHEARKQGANAVVGIETTLVSLLGTQEMVLTGTAVNHPLLPSNPQLPASSDMTPEEQWNMAHLGYLPLQLVMGVSVYSLGLSGKFTSFFRSLAGGELSGLSEILYEAREKVLARIEQQAEACGADEVVGVKFKVYDLGYGMVEVMALGTAVKKVSGAGTASANLPPQAIIRDRDTLVVSDNAVGLAAGNRQASATKVQGGPARMVIGAVAVLGYLMLTYLRLKNGH